MRSNNDARDRIRGRLDAVIGAEQPTRVDVATFDDQVSDLDTERPRWLDDPESAPAESGWVPDRFRGARFDPGRRGMIALAVVGVVVALVGGGVVLRDRDRPHSVPALPAVAASEVQPGAVPSGAVPSDPADETPAQVPATEELVVSVVGLVHRNGLVRLPPGSRIADAIAAAGGAKDGADLFSLNMAQRVADGDQILVGVAGTDGGPPVLGSGVAPAGGRSAPPAGAPAAAGKVNINDASETELDGLPGVGPVTAAAIIAWRTTNGRFTEIEQLGEVDGIGPTRLAKLRDSVTL
ncbi:ComEA family DNA-binding protein [Antrihabitans sp. NCIMB 15449]|uniref:ComEA family DNA-binding protein n=1 Tax=Antrihabitans spumae TaxID=3373370 RepID=A0ABW7JPN6_9NOCA